MGYGRLMKTFGICALLFGTFSAQPARAGTTVGTFTIIGGGFNASGTITLTTTSDPTVDQITGITGTFSTTSGGFSGVITGLSPASYSSTNPTAGTISTYDNLYYPTAMAPALKGHPAGGTLDDNGLDFMVSGGYTVNIFERGATSGFLLSDGLFSDLDHDVPVNFVLTLPSPPVPPTITKVANAEGEALTIAPNTWVEIKGSNLAPVGVSSPACVPGYCWQLSDFVNNQLPTQLQGVSVTLNGEKAFVYYISAVQINILTPPDLKDGPVTVQVTNTGVPSASFIVQAQTYSESFFVFNGGSYVVATHLNYSLIGPTSLYPGLSTPAQPGETIVIYANGFGPTTVPVVSGSETQSGSLPITPTIQIGSAMATVTYAALISPGLYQFNVMVPTSVAAGDNTIQASNNGQSTQAGTLITIQ
jgi:uncharacterized protein (TIGR03437 family)